VAEKVVAQVLETVQQQVAEAVQDQAEELQKKVEEIVIEKVAETVQKKAEEVQQQTEQRTEEKRRSFDEPASNENVTYRIFEIERASEGSTTKVALWVKRDLVFLGCNHLAARHVHREPRRKLLDRREHRTGAAGSLGRGHTVDRAVSQSRNAGQGRLIGRPLLRGREDPGFAGSIRSLLGISSVQWRIDILRNDGEPILEDKSGRGTNELLHCSPRGDI
jgi:hypothetical protein